MSTTADKDFETPGAKAPAPAKNERKPKTGQHQVTLVKGRRGQMMAVMVVRARDGRIQKTMKEIIRLDITSKPDLVRRIREGFPVQAFSEFSVALGISEKELGHYTGVPPRTLARRKASGHLQPDESDRVARIALLLEEAIELFDGDREKAAHWFKTPKRALGGATPLEYADTEPGAQEVRALIGRLQHGVVA